MVFENLLEDYTPDALLFRDAQIKELDNVFKNFEKFQMGSNKILLGYSGTGKTATIKYVMKTNPKYLYLSASDQKTSARILKQVCPKNCKTIDQILKFLIEDLKANPRILIIDEINKIFRINEFFDDLNTLFRATGMPIFLISAKREILDKMPEDARHTLFLQRVEFFPYDSKQLEAIVKDRIRQLPPEVTEGFSQELIEYICIKAKDENGRARTALDMVKHCICEQIFTLEFIDKMVMEKQKLDFTAWYQNLTSLESEFLDNIVRLYPQVKIDLTPTEIATRMGGRSPQQISNLINKFEDDTIIKPLWVKNKHGKGRMRIISMTQDMYAKLSGIIEHVYDENHKEATG